MVGDIRQRYKDLKFATIRRESVKRINEHLSIVLPIFFLACLFFALPEVSLLYKRLS